MTLEDRVAYWYDGGLAPYRAVYSMQERLAQLRRKGDIPDVILSFQHPAEVNFGSRDHENLFNDHIEADVQERYGSYRNERGVITPEAIEYFERDGIAGLPFSKMKRGGGATVLDEGQLVYYPIVDVEGVTGKRFSHDDLSPQAAYKYLIDEIMHETLTQLGVPNVEIVAEKYDERIRADRRDVWHQDDSGKSYKLGSKGVAVSPPIAYHGFVFYVDKKGIEHFDLVKPCGYDHEQVSVTSVEDVYGTVPHDAFHEHVKRSIADKFRYNRIEPAPPALRECIEGILTSYR